MKDDTYLTWVQYNYSNTVWDTPDVFNSLMLRSMGVPQSDTGILPDISATTCIDILSVCLLTKISKSEAVTWPEINCILEYFWTWASLLCAGMWNCCFYLAECWKSVAALKVRHLGSVIPDKATIERYLGWVIYSKKNKGGNCTQDTASYWPV